MKTAILITVILLSASLAFGGDIIVRPMVPDLYPNDNLFAPGSYENPYILTDSNTGQEIGRMSPMVPDLDSTDNFMTPGSYSNPWVIETD